jgi:membrane-bound ClpP family serine protease
VRAYVIVTGIVFFLLVLAHLARVGVEGVQVLKDVFFTISTAISVVLCVWAARLAFKPTHPREPSDA